MHNFLNNLVLGLRGIQLPVSHETLIDYEFADDTTLYLHGDLDNLRKLQKALEQFCIASGARVNWNKSCAFWVSDKPTPSWTPQDGFQWIPKGTAIRYLGCQIGLNLSPAAQAAPLLAMLRKKLLQWSTANLSLAGRVIVTNHIIMASIWYVASCCIFSKSFYGQILRLVRNFIWSGKHECECRAKVAWTTIVKPTSAGGLGLIDPWQQSRSLLCKFVIRSLLPNAGPWKQYMLAELYRLAPKTGGPWANSIKWLFIPTVHKKNANICANKLTRTILSTWSSITTNLKVLPPASDDAWLRQPLMWNPNFTCGRGHMFGMRTKYELGFSRCKSYT